MREAIEMVMRVGAVGFAILGLVPLFVIVALSLMLNLIQGVVLVIYTSFEILSDTATDAAKTLTNLIESVINENSGI